MASQTTPTFFATPKAFRQWLERHADSAPELLVGFHKVGSCCPSMGWSESVDEALCFGWIDGIRRRIDEHTYSIRFTPRKPSSIWSAVNIAKVEQLQAAGRMTPAGLAALLFLVCGLTAFRALPAAVEFPPSVETRALWVLRTSLTSPQASVMT